MGDSPLLGKAANSSTDNHFDKLLLLSIQRNCLYCVKIVPYNLTDEEVLVIGPMPPFTQEEFEEVNNKQCLTTNFFNNIWNRSKSPSFSYR